MEAAAVADRLTGRTGRRWSVEGRCPGGEVGAYFVSSDNRRYVMKWSTRSGALADLAVTVERLQDLRARGFPMPRYEPPISIGEAVVVVQERLDGGQVRDQISVNLVEQLLDAFRLKVGVDEPSDRWFQFIQTTLREGADGWCLHRPLAEHSVETRAILGWARGVADEVATLPSGDLVHLDLHHRNVLQTDTDLLAVIDWEGARIGDQVFDLVTLVFNLAVGDAEPGVENLLWSAINATGSADAVAAYVAHMCIRQLDWQIRHHPDAVELWIDQAQRVRQLLG